MTEAGAALWTAISHPKRRELLDVLVGSGPLSVGQLTARAALSYPGASQHLAVLARAGLVTSERRGRSQLYRAELGPLVDTFSWMSGALSTWRNHTQRLGAYLDDTDPDREDHP